MQQLLEPSIAEYLKKQKEEKMDKLAEVASYMKMIVKYVLCLDKMLKHEYLDSCIAFWNEYKKLMEK